jgi:predicted NBD/HSP70 family sugar kinase
VTGSSFYSVEPDAGGRSGGTTQAETRVYNERLILTLIRRHARLSKVELTHLTGLSAQTISTLVNRAADKGLLSRLEPLRHRLGQPTVPYALNPDGAHSFGLKIDRRSADIAMINFVGEVGAFERIAFDYPTPDAVMAFAKDAIARMLGKRGSSSSRNVVGLGIASPFHLRSWGQESNAPRGALDAWRRIDIRADLDRAFDWPVYLFNDAMVAAGAELMFGSGAGRADFLYAYIGHVIGGGIVLDHHLFPGRNRQAGALGEMLAPGRRNGAQGVAPLMQIASLSCLAAKLSDRDQETIWSSPETWGDLGEALNEWIEDVADGLACAARAATALLDIDNLVIDGAVPAGVRKEIARATRRKLSSILAERPEPFSVLEGAFGHMAPAIGGACIPLFVEYSNDKEVLFKESEPRLSAAGGRGPNDRNGLSVS